MRPSKKSGVRRIVPFVLFLFMAASIWGQANNTMFFMPGLPQANRVNPAYQPDCNFHIGIPFLAPLQQELSSSSLAWEDVIYKNPMQSDSLITFLHPLGNEDAFLEKLRPMNLLASGVGSSMLSFGFRTEVGYFSMEVTNRYDGNIYYPADLANLLIKGAEDGREYNMNGIGADFMLYEEIAVGWSGQILDNLRIGARAKVLFGAGDIATKSSDLKLTTSEENWLLESNMQVNASLPFAEVIYNDEGNIEEIVVDPALEDPKFSTLYPYMFNAQNLGFGLDIGVDYRPIEKLQIGVSVVDLGYIKWKDEVHQLDYTTTFDFPGFDFNPFELSDEFTFGEYLDSSFSQLADSLSSFAAFTPGAVYSKRLNTKLYVGVSYDVTPSVNFGLLSRTDLLNGIISEQVTASANFKAGRMLNFSLSYSYMNYYFRNIGAGISLNAGPVNLYLVSDNALNVLFWPEKARSATVWFGFNLLFGYKDKTDYPLVH